MEPPLAWWARLRAHLRPHRRALGYCIFLSVVGQALVGLLPLIQKVVLDDAVLSHRRPLVPWLGALVGVGVVGFALHYQRRYLAARASLGLMHDLRVAIYRRLHALDLARHDQLSTGDVMARASGDVMLVQMFVNQIPLLVANVTLLVVALAVMPEQPIGSSSSKMEESWKAGRTTSSCARAGATNGSGKPSNAPKPALERCARARERCAARPDEHSEPDLILNVKVYDFGRPCDLATSPCPREGETLLICFRARALLCIAWPRCDESEPCFRSVRLSPTKADALHATPDESSCTRHS